MVLYINMFSFCLPCLLRSTFMNPFCGFQPLCGIQIRSKVGIEKSFNARGWVIQKFPKYLFALQKSLDGWNTKLGNTREVLPPLYLQYRAGKKSHIKASKVVRGCGHIFESVWGQEGGREDDNRFFSPYSSFTSKNNAERLLKGVFFGSEVLFGKWTWVQMTPVVANRNYLMKGPFLLLHAQVNI